MNERVKKLLQYLLARRKEPSSVAAYIILIGAITGHNLSPEMVANWVAIIAGIGSLVLYLYPELGE